MVEVLLLVQANCGFCDQAKALLGRLSTEYALSVTTLDLASPEGETLALRDGIAFAPGILVNGKLFSYGRPSERALRREIERRLADKEKC